MSTLPPQGGWARPFRSQVLCPNWQDPTICGPVTTAPRAPGLAKGRCTWPIGDMRARAPPLHTAPLSLNRAAGMTEGGRKRQEREKGLSSCQPQTLTLLFSLHPLPSDLRPQPARGPQRPGKRQGGAGKQRPHPVAGSRRQSPAPGIRGVGTWRRGKAGGLSHPGQALGAGLGEAE